MNEIKPSICIKCKQPFVLSFRGQMTCKKCLTNPLTYIETSESSVENDPPNHERRTYVKSDRPRVYKQKNCDICKELYTPTGPRQEICEKCAPVKKCVSAKKISNNVDSTEEIHRDIHSRYVTSDKIKEALRDPRVDSTLRLGATLTDDKESILRTVAKNLSTEEERAQRVSIQTFVSAGRILLYDLSLDEITVTSQGLRVSVEKLRKPLA